MEQAHGDKLLEVVEEHIKQCGEIGIAALLDGETFVAGQAFTACKLAEKVRDVLSGNHARPLTAVARLPFEKPPEEKPKRQRKPRAPKAEALPRSGQASLDAPDHGHAVLEERR